jgi:thioredoxin-like negative regulator of GroEL
VAQAEKQGTPAASAQLLVRGGVLLLEKGRVPAEALHLAELARAASGESVEAALLWAQAQVALGRPREALSALEDVIHRSRGKRTPLVARVCFVAANAHLALDELVEAHDLLKTAFGMDARNGELAMLLALVSLDLDDERTADRALFAITGAAARTDADRCAQATAFYHLAAGAYAKGDGGKARRLVAKALASEPGHTASRALLEKLDANGSAVVKRGSLGPPSPVAVPPLQRTRLPGEGAA